MTLFNFDGPIEGVESPPVFKCQKCGHDAWTIKGASHDHGVFGIYCQKCGRWLKWLGKIAK